MLGYICTDLTTSHGQHDQHDQHDQLGQYRQHRQHGQLGQLGQLGQDDQHGQYGQHDQHCHNHLSLPVARCVTNSRAAIIVAHLVVRGCLQKIHLKSKLKAS